MNCQVARIAMNETKNFCYRIHRRGCATYITLEFSNLSVYYDSTRDFMMLFHFGAKLDTLSANLGELRSQLQKIHFCITQIRINNK